MTAQLNYADMELELLRREKADLVAALKEIDSIATGKQAKAIIRAQQVARAAVLKAEGKP